MPRQPDVPGDSFGVYQISVADFEWRRGTGDAAMDESIREGQCHCGALRYRIRGEAVATAACHCADCQRQSGSAFGMSLIVRADAFEWLAGTPSRFMMKAESGADKECLFCGDCGVRILNRISTRPGTLNVKPGTLDDSTGVAPDVHVWTCRKKPWVAIPDGVPAFERNPVRG